MNNAWKNVITIIFQVTFNGWSCCFNVECPELLSEMNTVYSIQGWCAVDGWGVEFCGGGPIVWCCHILYGHCMLKLTRLIVVNIFTNVTHHNSLLNNMMDNSPRYIYIFIYLCVFVWYFREAIDYFETLWKCKRGLSVNGILDNLYSSLKFDILYNMYRPSINLVRTAIF